jgi:hypothetical protein
MTGREKLLEAVKVAIEAKFIYTPGGPFTGGTLIGTKEATKEVVEFVGRELAGQYMTAEEMIALGHEFVEAGVAKMKAEMKAAEAKAEAEARA